MARQRSPNRDKAFDIWKESGGEILLKDIAAQLEISESQVRKWKSQDKWEQSQKVALPKTKSNATIEKETVIKQNNELVESVVVNQELNDKQRLFCLHFVKCFNATKAYQKAYGCSYATAGSNGYALLQKTEIQAEIQRLKRAKLNQAMMEPEDIFQKYMDIAFADITDFVEFGQEEVPVMTTMGPVKGPDGEIMTEMVNVIRFNPSTAVDGTIITEVKHGKNGSSIKLADRMKALDWLTDHMDMATPEQKAKVEKLQAETDRLKADKGEDIGDIIFTGEDDLE